MTKKGNGLAQLGDSLGGIRCDTGRKKSQSIANKTQKSVFSCCCEFEVVSILGMPGSQKNMMDQQPELVLRDGGRDRIYCRRRHAEGMLSIS